MSAVTAIVDGHVHLHACYDLDAFFEHAHGNLSATGRRAGDGPVEFFLLFTECQDDDFFGGLRSLATGAASPLAPPRHWTLRPTAEEGAVTAVSGDRRLHLIAGRQVACKEGLEVLLLATTRRFKDRRPIREVLQEAGALRVPHVIPWGMGKWFFKRARLLSELLRDHQRTEMFFLGDEGGRPGFWPYPRHFREAAALGVRDLPGTDPLPFPHDVAKVGKMGFRLPVDFDEQRPVRSIVSALAERARPIERFARLEPPLRFVQNQLAMQLRKRQTA